MDSFAFSLLGILLQNFQGPPFQHPYIAKFLAIVKSQSLLASFGLGEAYFFVNAISTSLSSELNHVHFFLTMNGECGSVPAAMQPSHRQILALALQRCDCLVVRELFGFYKSHVPPSVIELCLWALLSRTMLDHSDLWPAKIPKKKSPKNSFFLGIFRHGSQSDSLTRNFPVPHCDFHEGPISN